jgi:hypothetical protein
VDYAAACACNTPQYARVTVAATRRRALLTQGFPEFVHNVSECQTRAP